MPGRKDDSILVGEANTLHTTPDVNTGYNRDATDQKPAGVATDVNVLLYIRHGTTLVSKKTVKAKVHSGMTSVDGSSMVEKQSVLLFA